MEKVAELKDFDWQLSLAVSSDKLATLNEPLVNVDLQLKPGDCETTSFSTLEMDSSELDKFIQFLESANKDLIETNSLVLSKVTELTALPVSWFVKRQADQTFYVLDLKACSINDVSAQVAPHFAISSTNLSLKNSDESQERQRKPSGTLLSHPELILKVDLSLNDMKEVYVEDLMSFPELRSLDLSLNVIHSFRGIEIATKLVYLNLSYNNIRFISNEALAECINLQTLDLSVNKITSLVGFPILPNLMKLILKNNKLKGLQGIQVLRSLRQVNVSSNKITSIIHLCPCLEMTELNVSNNLLDTVSDVVASIAPLTRLQQIILKGNPILTTVPLVEMQSALVRETAVVLMDGVNIRPVKMQFKSISHHQPPSPRANIKVDLKKAVRESMKEGTVKKREKIHDSIYSLHKKILTLRNELEEHEDLAVADTEAWCRYIDTLTIEEAKSLTTSQIRAAAIAEADGFLPTQVTAVNKKL